MPARKYRRYVVDSRLKYFKPDSGRIERGLIEEISSGLASPPRFISPKFLYDKRGSELFEKICAVPEYYLTRSETSILETLGGELASHLDGKFRVVELGSGSAVKTRIILDVVAGVQGPAEYFPIDISDILAESSERLLQAYPALKITGIIDTYEGGLEFLRERGGKKSLILFLGSSFGNFSPGTGCEFLRAVHKAMRPGDLLLIGLDLIKDKGVIESAYDDPQGATAEFQINVLSRVNRDIGADFDPDNFEYYSRYDESHQRVEMYLRSLAEQSVVAQKSGLLMSLRKGELIHVEYSYKFTVPQIRSMFGDVGFEVRRIWLDRQGLYSVSLVSR